MTDDTVRAISERADNGIVASVWRAGNNLGMCFSKQGKTVTWDDMDVNERQMAVQNLYAAADFFAQCIMQGRPDGSHVEQLTPHPPRGED
jgi:hypothetical protein